MLRSNSHRTQPSIDTTSSPDNHIMPPPTPSTTFSRKSRDTGFPEPFNKDRNTTWIHPEANLDPDFELTHDEAAFEQAIRKRHRRRPWGRNKYALNHGRIDPDDAVSQTMISATRTSLSGVEEESETKRPCSPGDSAYSLSKGGDDSRFNNDEDTPPTSPSASSRRSKRGLLRKWRQK